MQNLLQKRSRAYYPLNGTGKSNAV